MKDNVMTKHVRYHVLILEGGEAIPALAGRQGASLPSEFRSYRWVPYLERRTGLQCHGDPQTLGIHLVDRKMDGEYFEVHMGCRLGAGNFLRVRTIKVRIRKILPDPKPSRMPSGPKRQYHVTLLTGGGRNPAFPGRAGSRIPSPFSSNNWVGYIEDRTGLHLCGDPTHQGANLKDGQPDGNDFSITLGRRVRTGGFTNLRTIWVRVRTT